MISAFRDRLLGRHPYNTIFNYNWVNVRSMIRSFRGLKRYFRGRVIDLGAGSCPYYEIISSPKGSYVAMDYLSALPKTENSRVMRVAGDLHSIPMKSESVDTVFCAQVLSQVTNPALAVKEMARILRPSGSVILSAPSISPIHSEPADFYRFTPDGLRAMLESTGLKVREIHIQGQLFSSFALSLAMSLVLSPIAPNKEMKLLRTNQLLFAPLIAFVNLGATFLDWILPFNRTPVNFIVVATKG